MARRAPKREYREVAAGPSKYELLRLPPGWSPLDDYRAAKAAGQAATVSTQLQIDAVRATCPCPNCTASRSGLSA
ncbi:hypothetical protein [Streptomyces sp. NRRL WC-3742]|uniref:hypothetical protein n=1 Tax=Streptomyces sp. NRRL WC-3742 TaxID=1463934 RepID=UPI0004C4F64A|nr:hypothetical protein [Streptomyces sp. NRRL WC-3742]